MGGTDLKGRYSSGLLAVILAAILGSGCATVPFDYSRSESTAIAPSDSTRLGQTVAAWSEQRPGVSAFYPLEDGLDALGVRLRLIELADHGIDAQYFLIKGDIAGHLFTGKLLRAADRGVRVRFLIDDVFTTGLDPELALLNAHPNIEVRLFNPLPRQGLRWLNFLAQFERANRRMHNKSFTVDNVVTIVGGRNIADEYFQIHSDVEFADYELLGFGPVAPEVSATFDLFWNSKRAVPMEAFGRKVDDADLDEMRRSIAREIEEAPDGVYARAVESGFLRELMQEKIRPYAAPATVVTDRPEKLKNPIGSEYRVLASALRRAVEDAEHEVIFVTPYFVPRREGVAFFREIRSKGVRIVVVTNSLASTNHVVVHSGYAPYRKDLLAAGVELYEVKADSLSASAAAKPDGPARLTLHTKAVVVDRELLFVGSLNVDPRSIDINTEMGLFLESPSVAARFAEQLESDLSPFTYRVVLGDEGRLEWHYDGHNGITVETSEPQAGFWRQLAVLFYRLLPIEGQL